MKRSIAVLILLVAMWAPSVGVAQTKTHWSVGSDVFPWFFSGYSVLGMIEPSASLRFGVEIWGFDFPAWFVELQEANASEGWKRRADLGVALYGDYFLTRGWHVGVLANTFRSTVRRAGFAQRGSFWSAEILGRVGYRWQIWAETGLFLNPYVAAGPLWVIGQTPQIGGERFEEAAFQFLGTVHLGWRF